MDLMTIKRKFVLGMYSQCRQFDQDMQLMFDNALLFNTNNAPILAQARQLQQFYRLGYGEIVTRVERG